MTLTIKKFVKNLFTPHYQKSRWIYLLAAFPFIAFALAGWEYGAGALYVIPAVLCLVQYFYPTICGWLLFFSIFCIGLAVYFWLLLTDLLKILTGNRPSALLDTNDSFVFVLLVILLCAITYGLFRIRPKTLDIK